ncbi:MAG TPA: hypothetical protein PLP17_05285, partial [Oligoflexia bacterium]|nr:hypothetical protein [Oligoflexia bacterium]
AAGATAGTAPAAAPGDDLVSLFGHARKEVQEYGVIAGDLKQRAANLEARAREADLDLAAGEGVAKAMTTSDAAQLKTAREALKARLKKP